MKENQKLLKHLTSAVLAIVIISIGVYAFYSGWATSSYGSFPITDAFYLSGTMIAAIGLVIFSIRKYRLCFPRIKPLLVIVLSYWLIAIVFGGLYKFIYSVDPHSFSGVTNGSNWEFSYYSFLIITTLGYDNIHPISFIVRWLTLFEVCIGLFYIAVLVAVVLQSGREELR